MATKYGYPNPLHYIEFTRQLASVKFSRIAKECGEIVSEEVITGFFRIRGYKKGTMHFEFIDEEVWAKFNQAVANIKGWQLPQNVRAKKKKAA